MKYLLLCLAVASTFFLGLSQKVAARKFHSLQHTGKDTIPVRTMEKTAIMVKDLMNGEGLDSVYVTVGTKKRLHKCERLCCV